MDSTTSDQAGTVGMPPCVPLPIAQDQAGPTSSFHPLIILSSPLLQLDDLVEKAKDYALMHGW